MFWTLQLLAAILTTRAAAQDAAGLGEPYIPPPEIHEWRAVSEMPNRQSFEDASKWCSTIAETMPDASLDHLPIYMRYAVYDNAYKDCMARSGYIYVVTPLKDRK
jgi:hypothetical protein